MGLIADLKPTNLAQEKAKFFADDSYNPQFKYRRPFTQKEFTKYGQPDPEVAQHAVDMLEKYGVYQEKDVTPCTREEVKAEIEEILVKLNLPPLEIIFDKRLLSHVQIYQAKGQITFRTPIAFGARGLRHKINHEIQSHYLRRQNQQLQTVPRSKGIKFRSTEEGLATLNSYLFDTEDEQIFRKTYINSWAEVLAHQHSFRTVFDKLRGKGVDPTKAWRITLKQKRGLEDTSQPGGFRKSHLYLEGMIKVWRWLLDETNDPRQIYAGRLSIEAIKKHQAKLNLEDITYPTFFSDLDAYREELRKIGQANHLERFLDRD